MSRIWIPILVLCFMVGSSVSMPEGSVVMASDVLANITDGKPADFDNCTVIGDLNLRSLKIEKPVHFNHTLFQNSVNCQNTIFNRTAYFFDSTFNKNALFSYSTFNRSADFDYSTYNGCAIFDHSTFNGAANFCNSIFNNCADFGDSTFNSGAQFWSSIFNGDTFFWYSINNGDTVFDHTVFAYATFNGAIFFTEAIFNNQVAFDSAIFNEGVQFSGTTFNDFISFRNSTINVADFNHALFSKEAYFSDAVFKGYARFNSSQFKGDALFENTTFEGKLSLTKTRYDKLYIRWYAIKGGLIFDDAAYMSLMNNFRELGYFEDYDSCYVQYRKEHRGHPWPLVGGVAEPIMKCFDFFLEWFYGYGTRPLNAIGFSFAIIIVFGIIWKAIGLGGPNDLTGEVGRNWEKPDNPLDILGFSAHVFLSGTKLFIDPPDTPEIKGRSRSMIKKAFTLERILGALFSILFFLAIGRTIIR